jgi:Domain of unknown function (DUF4340)
MKLGRLLIAAVVLAALVGALYWSNRKQASSSTVKASVDTTPKILSLDESHITGLTIKRPGQPDLELQKANGNWNIIAPKPLGADEEAVSNVLSAVASLSSDRVVEDKAANLSEYGLKNPPLELDVSASGKDYRLLVGDKTPSGNATYAMLAGDPRLFTIADYNATAVDKSENDLRDRRLLTVDFDKASEIQLATPKQDITFGRNKDTWQIEKPRPLRADSYEVNDLIRSLRNAKMKLDGGVTPNDEKKSASVYASGRAVATVKVTALSRTQTLQLRKANGDYYAKSSILPGVYEVLGDVGAGVSKKLDDFLDKKLFDFGYVDPNKVEIHDGSKAYFLTRSNSDWWGPDGKKLDSSSVDALLSKIRDLSATKYPLGGFNTPEIQILVTPSDKKPQEKVLISEAGDEYVAKRADEPELYGIPVSAISGIQKAAAGLKPAAPPAKAKK